MQCQAVNFELVDVQSKQLSKRRILDFLELVSVRNVFQYCLQELKLNGYQSNNSLKWLDGLTMPFTFEVCQYNSNDDLANILLGNKREPPFYFYSICGLSL